MTSKLLFAIIMTAWASSVFAQSSDISKFSLGDATIDLAVPESPAFSALGLTPQEVTRPNSGRELATSILNGVDRNGSFQTGGAIDTAPYMLLAGSRITLEKYRNQYSARFLSRWLLSYATSKGGGSDDPSVKIAVGTRFTLFDYGDPRTDIELLECLAQAADLVQDVSKAISPGTSPEMIEIENKRREEETRRLTKLCRVEAPSRRWNKSAWILGIAPTWTSKDGKITQIEYSGTALWTSLGYGFEGVPYLCDRAMLVIYAKMRSDEVAPDLNKPGKFIEQDNFTVGTRLFIGAPNTKFNLEALLIHNDRMDHELDKYWNIGLGLEQRVADNLWLNMSYGMQLARDEQVGNGFVILSGLNWGFGPQ